MTQWKYLVWNKIRWILHIKYFLVLTPVFAWICTNSRTAFDKDERRIGCVTFSESDVIHSSNYNNPICTCLFCNKQWTFYILVSMGSTAWATCWPFKPRTGNEWRKHFCCWIGRLTKRHPKTPAKSPAGQTQGSSHLSWLPAQSHSVSPNIFSYWAAKSRNWVKETGLRLHLTSVNPCAQQWDSPSMTTALQHPSRIFSRTQQTGEKMPGMKKKSQCTDLCLERY